jgi:hypothetical protein
VDDDDGRSGGDDPRDAGFAADTITYLKRLGR